MSEEKPRTESIERYLNYQGSVDEPEVDPLHEAPALEKESKQNGCKIEIGVFYSGFKISPRFFRK